MIMKLDGWKICDLVCLVLMYKMQVSGADPGFPTLQSEVLIIPIVINR